MVSKGFVCVYITCRDAEEARKISFALVEKKLVACANMVHEVDSVYRWNGKIHEEKEALIFAKTMKKHAKKITEVVKGMHSYENPAILFYDVAEGSDEYLKWVEGETQ
ncbi:MAG: divalent-cation tolerance protein CutA [Candidatus Diapherotrites archaeon]